MSISRVSQNLISCVSYATRKPQQFVALVKFYSCQTGNYEFVKVETAGEKKNVGIVTLNRPKVLNALNNQTIIELNHALDHFDSDSSIAAIVITGCEKAFAAGGDLQEMNLYASSYDFVHSHWDAIPKKKKPLIAAVNGYVLGGASEIAMMCDIIYAGEKSKFAIPDIIIGIVPGAGGTQRLPRVIGKSKAMEMLLTGKMITAQEAERSGLCSKVFPVDKVVEEAVKLGEKIASHSPLIVSIAKEAVNAAYETTLQEGLLVEKSLFHSTFCLEDRKEGMTAFLEKRPLKYKNQ